eukprot:CAMPEP_0198139764 /NCGR_PEP_ID=MMETSP1443-20131203/3008_1 /TAXON_ID=186043 /ORGANISM="Entomoneis sp., Strain CCMP2396" /LENGTH=57 /DNA_ID=CAMNT_0043801981 /DNA_START=287 /DNA_END=457 /DNA_ORIENTATION=+
MKGSEGAAELDGDTVFLPSMLFDDFGILLDDLDWLSSKLFTDFVILFDDLEMLTSDG